MQKDEDHALAMRLFKKAYQEKKKAILKNKTKPKSPNNHAIKIRLCKFLSIRVNTFRVSGKGFPLF